MGLKHLALIGALLLLPAAGYAAAPIRVMLLDGESAGPYHDWKATTPVLKRELEEAGLFQVDVVTAPPSGAGLDGFRPDFSQYRAIVLNYDAPAWPAALEAAFDGYVAQGGGIVVVHAADNAFPGWKAFNEMTGIGGWRNRGESAGPYWYFRGGKLVSDNTPGPAGSHGARLPFRIVTRAPGSPIMKGLPKVWMHQGDELYARLRGPGGKMQVLATAYSDPANHGTGRDEPILMTSQYGKGRIFHTTLGHDVAAMSCVGFIVTLQRGTEWVATGKVTLRKPASFPTAETVSYRPDLAGIAAAGTSK